MYPRQINTLGDHIRKRRLDLKLSQKQAADLMGVTTSTVTNWERQRNTPALFFIPAIIQFLGFDPLPRAETLAARLTRYRRVRGTPQKELAQHLGVDPCTLARWERGERTPTGLYRKLVVRLLSDANPDQ